VATARKPGAADPTRRPGRARDPRADKAILAAAVALLTEVGFGGLTVDAVAHRAGVGKATIYRRWDSKERLVLDALSTEHQPLEAPNTGGLRADLMALYEPMTEPVAQQTAVRLMPALAAEAAGNPALAEQLRAFVSLRRAPPGAFSSERSTGVRWQQPSTSTSPSTS
jgi:AcrR family transcriptional regulator